MDRNLMALAIIPGLLLIIYVYRKDKVEKEPLGLILRIIFLGVLSCFAAAYLEMFESRFLPQYPKGSLEYALTTSFCMAALVEETVKYLVGFAIYENINYVARYGLETAVVRAFTAIPLHAFCGVFMGVFYANSKKASILGNKGAYAGYTLLAFLVPMLIHGTYDTFAFLGNNGTMQLLIFVVLLYIAAITTIKRMSAADYRAGFYPQARSIDYNVDI